MKMKSQSIFFERNSNRMKKIFISSFNNPEEKRYKGLQVIQISTVAELVKQIF